MADALTETQIERLIVSYLRRHPEGRSKEDIYALLDTAEEIVIAYLALTLVLEGEVDVDLGVDEDGRHELRYFPVQESMEE